MPRTTIIEYCGKEGMRTVPAHKVHDRCHNPQPGDLIEVPEHLRDYPFDWRHARIDSIDSTDPNLLQVCCNQGSAFLQEEGHVSISGGPFARLEKSDLEATCNLHPTPFWNWGDNSPGADQGIAFLLYRPLFKLVRKPANPFCN